MPIMIFITVSNDKIVPAHYNLQIKKRLKREYTVLYPDFMIIYVDLSDYQVTDNVYTRDIKPDILPYVQCVYNNMSIGRITNADSESIDSVLKQITTKLRQRNEAMQQAKTVESVNTQQSAHASETKQVATNTPHNDVAIDQAIITKQLREQQRYEKLEELRRLTMIQELTKIKQLREQDKS